jgi:hypothetical protein
MQLHATPKNQRRQATNHWRFPPTKWRNPSLYGLFDILIPSRIQLKAIVVVQRSRIRLLVKLLLLSGIRSVYLRTLSSGATTSATRTSTMEVSSSRSSFGVGQSPLVYLVLCPTHGVQYLVRKERRRDTRLATTGTCLGIYNESAGKIYRGIPKSEIQDMVPRNH